MESDGRLVVTYDLVGSGCVLGYCPRTAERLGQDSWLLCQELSLRLLRYEAGSLSHFIAMFSACFFFVVFFGGEEPPGMRHMQFEVFIILKNPVVVSGVGGYQCFREAHCFHLQLCRWRYYILEKCQYPFSRPHSVVTRKGTLMRPWYR